MLIFNKRYFLFLSGLVVPLLSLFNPGLLSINGIGPSWSVLWLLPLAIEEGPVTGMFAGLCLGMVVDSIYLDGVTQVPSLILLGFWWGGLDRKLELKARIFNLGLLAWLGTFFIGLTIWIQKIFFVKDSMAFFFHNWFFYTLLAKATVTGMLAPLICYLILIRCFRSKV